MGDLVEVLVDILEKDYEREGARNPMMTAIDYRQHIEDKILAVYQDLVLYWTGPRVVGERQTVEFISNQARNCTVELIRLHGGSKLVRPSKTQARMQYV
jgi:hypothetical protein